MESQSAPETKPLSRKDKLLALIKSPQLIRGLAGSLALLVAVAVGFGSATFIGNKKALGEKSPAKVAHTEKGHAADHSKAPHEKPAHENDQAHAGHAAASPSSLKSADKQKKHSLKDAERLLASHDSDHTSHKETEHSPAAEDHASSGDGGHSPAGVGHGHAEEHGRTGHGSTSFEKRNFLLRWFSLVVESAISVQRKVEQIQRAEEESERLTTEVAHLRLVNESLRFECQARTAQDLTKSMEFQIQKETGTQVGRTLATIQYKPPTHMPFNQLYTLGVSYFKGREDEKAAVIFSFLTSMTESDQFKNPQAILMTGVAWYRLDNLELADQFFDRVLKLPEGTENRQFKAQARLWRGLAAQRMGKRNVAQSWFRDLIDHHPRSTEASWINGDAGVENAADRDAGAED